MNQKKYFHFFIGLLLVLVLNGCNSYSSNRCEGDSDCDVCTDCSRCQHCNDDGETCGVCE